MNKALIFLIQVYQFFHPVIHTINLSVFGFSSVCRQTPTCSEYTISQIKKHGTITGLKRGVARVSKCRSLCQQSSMDS